MDAVTTAAIAANACNLCGGARDDQSEQAMVRCNVRKFSRESFPVWRCQTCLSIHSAIDVDLPHYYAGYPVFNAELNWMLNVVYASMLKRLRECGLKDNARILDYGCGNGVLVRYLQANGFPQTVGYDRFAEKYRDETVLSKRYDCIVSQDVIEHVDDPHTFLSELRDMLEPGAIVSIGTPDAKALDLKAPEDFVHALHQPYHRHILSSDALLDAGKRQGWELLRYYPTMYNNTLVPTMNPRFVLHYVRCFDDVYDLVSEPIRVNNWKVWSPVTAFYALFGYFFDRHTDVQAIFRAA